MLALFMLSRLKLSKRSLFLSYKYATAKTESIEALKKTVGNLRDEFELGLIFVNQMNDTFAMHTIR